MTDQDKSDLSDDERALSALLRPARGASPETSDAAFAASIARRVDDVRRGRRRAFYVPVVAGACAVVALVVSPSPDLVERVLHDGGTLIGDDAPRTTALVDGESDLVFKDAVIDDEDPPLPGELDDDTLDALAPILDARLARVASR